MTRHRLVSVTACCIDRCGVTVHTHQVVSETTTTTQPQQPQQPQPQQHQQHSVAIVSQAISAQVATFVRIPSHSSLPVGGKGRSALGTMVCTSFALRDDANTGPAGYVCLESVMEGELPGVDCCVGREIDLLAATSFVLVPAFFAAYVGCFSQWTALLPPRCLPRRWCMPRFQVVT